MSVHYEDDLVTIHNGDCLDVLRELPDESVHSVVTDPPYGLAATDPAHVADTITRWASGDRQFLPSGRGFMGKEWDSFVPPPAVWDECLRVLKPGGHLLAFAGSRTFDLMALSIRLSGFDIRDSVAWLYGSGFPKSMDVSKAIDRIRDDQDELLAVSSRLADLADAAGVTRRQVDETMGTSDMGGWWLSRIRGRAAVAAVENWARLRDIIPGAAELDDAVWRLNGRKGKWGNERADRLVGASGSNAILSPTQRVENPGTPVTEAASEWQGWGTALKPAFEPIVMARKPFSGTVAANILEHGTGAINIDATRIATDAPLGRTNHTTSKFIDNANGAREAHPRTVTVDNSGGLGRWPANVMLDEFSAAELDRQAPDTGGSGKASGPTLRHPTESGAAFGARRGFDGDLAFYGDRGGASRFFYVAKAPTSERPEHEGTVHATVKPLDLMKRLVRLVTPPGGVVLEPFAGSGTTVEAALAEGFRCIAIERETDYLPLIDARIHKPIEQSLFGDWDGDAA